MNARTNMDERKPQTNAEGREVNEMDAQKSLAAVCISNSRKDARTSLIKRLRKSDLLAFVANSENSRGARMATIASLDDPELLISIAVADGPMFIRKNALLRIDEICNGKPLDRNIVKRLAPCLKEKELLTRTVVLMDICDYDWCSLCDEDTVRALCTALYECSDMLEAVLLEDTFAHLAHRRIDLHKSLSAYEPDRYLMRSAYSPEVVNNVIYPNFIKEENVA